MKAMKKMIIAMIAALMMVASVAPLTASACGAPRSGHGDPTEMRSKAIIIVLDTNEYYKPKK